MKQLYIIAILITILSCAKQRDNHIVVNPDTVLVDNDTITAIEATPAQNYMTSTYDNPGSDPRHTASLHELSDSLVFKRIHDKLVPTLDERHQTFFSANSNLQLISHSSGDLFQNGEEDNCFVVYDKNHTRISIVIYDGLQDKYSELFRDIKVKNGLEDADCNYGAYGTLDYQLANELVYHRDYIMKHPLQQIEYSNCKIADISMDEDFILDSGCFASGFSAAGNKKSLCISTSSVYNNWECLMYDKNEGVFIIFYGQAFAD